MRTFSAPVLSALASGSVAIVTLIKLAFTGTPVYLNTSTWNLVWQRRYNLLTYSEFPSGVADAPVRGGLVSAAPSFSLYGASVAGIAIGADGVTASFAYKTFTQSTGVVYTLSMFVRMDDGNAPVLDAISTSAATSDFAIVMQGSVGFAQAVENVGGGLYRVSSTCTAGSTGTVNFGVVKYAAQGLRAFKVTGYQLEIASLPGPYTATTSTALTQVGDTYLGAYGLGQISAVTDKPGDVQGITLELHGADAARIALALDDADVVQGTPVTLYTAIIDTATYQILDAPVEWVGTLDTMAIGEDGTAATIAVTAESRAVDLLRGTPQFYSDADQRVINPTDGAFAYVVDQIDKPIVWPAKAFFYQ
jgi:hypothetical protein